MSKFWFIVTFALYILFIEYVSSMFIFDFKKYILKDKILNNMKFSYKWKSKYYYEMAMIECRKKLEDEKSKSLSNNNEVEIEE